MAVLTEGFHAIANYVDIKVPLSRLNSARKNHVLTKSPMAAPKGVQRRHAPHLRLGPPLAPYLSFTDIKQNADISHFGDAGGLAKALSKSS